MRFIFRLYKKQILALFLVSWSVLIIKLNNTPGWPVGTDSSLYMMLGKSFSQGTGYLDISSPSPKNAMLVPSGFPLFLSLFWFFGEPPLFLLKLTLSILLAAGALSCFLWLCSFMELFLAWLATMAFVSSPMFGYFSNAILTETIFIPVLYSALWLTFPAENKLQNRWSSWMALILMVFLARIRFVGIPFLGMAIILLLKRRDFVKLAVGFFLFGVWLILERFLTIPDNTGITYSGELVKQYPFFSKPIGVIIDLLAIYASNLSSFAGSMYTDILLPWFYSLHPMNILKRFLVLWIFLIGIFGLVSLWKQKREFRFLIAALIASWIPVFAWSPTLPIFRYLGPFFPFLLLFFIYPMIKRTQLSSRFALRSIPYVVLTLVLLNQFVMTLNKIGEEDDRKAFRKLNDEITAFAHKPQTILSPWNHYTYLRTDIKSCRIGSVIKDDFEACLSSDETWAILKLDETRTLLTPQECMGRFILLEPPLKIKFPWALYKISRL